MTARSPGAARASASAPASMVVNSELHGCARRRPLVARPRGHAALHRHREQLARKREHNALLGQRDLLDAVVAECTYALDTRTHDGFGRRGAGGEAQVTS